MTHRTNTSIYQIVSHVRGRIARTPVVRTPFPHLVVDDVLPADVFAAVRAALPAPQAMAAVSAMGWRSVANYQRHASALLMELSERHGDPIWRLLAASLGHDDIEAALRGAFADHVPEPQQVLELRREVRLDHAAAGAHLRPHTDAPILFMKSLIYVSSAAIDPSLDTVIYRPADPAARIVRFGAAGDYTDETYEHEDRGDHIEVARIAFRPNRLFTFPRARDTMHGLNPLASAAAPRYLISLHYKHRR